MLEALVVNETVLRPFHVALFIADHLNVKQAFWDNLLANTPDPQNGNDLAALAIRTYIENSLTNVGPEIGMKRISAVLLDPNSTWATLGLSTFTDLRTGQPLTAQLKEELVFMMNTYAKAWLGIVRDEIALEIGS